MNDKDDEDQLAEPPAEETEELSQPGMAHK